GINSCEVQMVSRVGSPVRGAPWARRASGRPLSEEELGADAEAVHLAGHVAGGAGAVAVPAGVPDVLGLDLRVGVQVPVQADRPALHHATLDRAVVEVQVRVPYRDFPGAAAGVQVTLLVAHKPEVRVRAAVDRAEPAQAAVITPVFARQEVAGLHVATV